MHRAAYDYAVRQLLQVGIKGKKILEIGSLDVNSTAQGLSLRALCADAKTYYGIDQAEGAGVDQVVGAVEFEGAGAYDIAISTEALEHTPRPEDILECAARALKRGGVLIVTAAGPERAPHDCSGAPWGGVEHYANITPDDLADWLIAGKWTDIQVEHNAAAGDVYARAVKG